MKTKILLMSSVFSTLFLTACQSTPAPPVVHRPNNILETTAIGKTKIAAQRTAFNYAKRQCGSKTAVVVADKVKYNGVLDEKTGRMVDQVGTVIGGILGTGSPNVARDDDYEYTISFRCQ